MEGGNLSKKSGHNMRIYIFLIYFIQATQTKQNKHTPEITSFKSNPHSIRNYCLLYSLPLSLSIPYSLSLSSTKHLIYTDHMYIPRVAYLPPPSFNLIWGDEFNRGNKTTSTPPPPISLAPPLSISTHVTLSAQSVKKLKCHQ